MRRGRGTPSHAGLVVANVLEVAAVGGSWVLFPPEGEAVTASSSVAMPFFFVRIPPSLVQALWRFRGGSKGWGDPVKVHRRPRLNKSAPSVRGVFLHGANFLLSSGFCRQMCQFFGKTKGAFT